MPSITRKRFVAFAFLAVSSVAALAALTPSSNATAAAAPLRYDIAMNGLSFSFEGGVNANNAPLAGTPFVVSGYIYPGGTFAQNGLLSGVLSDGSPEFPGLVVGTWTCSGWHLQDGDAESGPVVVTNQTFDFEPSEPGSQMITTEGIELADFHVPFERVITGGTGRFNGLSGQHTQVYVGHGLNVTQGFNTSVAFRPDQTR